VLPETEVSKLMCIFQPFPVTNCAVEAANHVVDLEYLLYCWYCIVYHCIRVSSFSALTLLVEQQERHPACKGQTVDMLAVFI